MYVSEKLEAGTVFINTYNKTDVAAPFGGVKQSGFGKDLGKAELCYCVLRCYITKESALCFIQHLFRRAVGSEVYKGTDTNVF